MKVHTFFLCRTPVGFEQVRERAKELKVHVASAAMTIVVCCGHKADLLKQGMPRIAGVYEDMIPLEVMQALPEEYVRSNVERIVSHYSCTWSKPGGHLLSAKRRSVPTPRRKTEPADLPNF